MFQVKVRPKEKNIVFTFWTIGSVRRAAFAFYLLPKRHEKTLQRFRRIQSANTKTTLLKKMQSWTRSGTYVLSDWTHELRITWIRAAPIACEATTV